MSLPYDAALAERLGADERGMRRYVLALLKTGEAQVPEGEERTTLFAGHFANIKRLADAGKLSVAGPFDKNDAGLRGLFLLNVETIEEARSLIETDPTVQAGVFVVELFPWYGSAALLTVNETHTTLIPGAG